ncbi:MAG TPA: VOC family protein [Longimicrobiales bacterium]|nr:VOC family protein [Longimicrobiales bacterium]
MSEHFRPQVGAVFSADIAVPQHEREVRFYSRVLSTGDAPLWRETDLMNSLGMPVIGLGELSPEYRDLPLQWMPHIQVADVAASVDRASRLGGSALMHARDDAGSSQWAVLRDPNGAAFGIIPVVATGAATRTGAADANTPSSTGRIYWLDLTIPDAPATRNFYSEVVGWVAQDVPMKDGHAQYADYNMLRKDGSPAAGVCHARGVNADLPPVWMIYLPVGDLAESVRRVESEGGSIVKAMRDGGGELVYAAVKDPVGACFALVQG